MHVLTSPLRLLAHEKGYPALRTFNSTESLAAWLREREIYPWVDVWKDMDHHTNFLPRITKHAGIKPLVDKENEGLDILEDYPINKCGYKDTYEEAFETALWGAILLIK